MREQGYVTMLDPFQIKYGQRVGGLMFIPALLGEVFWSAAILSALGATLSVILGMDMAASVILSAFIAVFYTFTGGLYAVAYTDVVQLFCIFIGLWVCIPAALLQKKTSDLSANPTGWIGQIGGLKEKLLWIDCMLLLIFGGIPWQVYFQRVLSSRTSKGAQRLSFVAGIGYWSLTEYSPWGNGTKTVSIPADQTSQVVPLVFQYLTPKWVAFIGLGAVSAAVMSSADSSVLSAASMFAHNIWKLTIRPIEREVIYVMRISIIAVGILATIMALTINSIYGLWYLCADLVYVILFPQLLCVVYFHKSNTYGCLAGYIVNSIYEKSLIVLNLDLFLRLSGGEALLHFKAIIHYPFYDPSTSIQYFPFRTMSMLASLLTTIFISKFTTNAFLNGKLPPEWDILGCVVNLPTDSLRLPDTSSFNASTMSVNSSELTLQRLSNGNTQNGHLKGQQHLAVASVSPLLHPDGKIVNNNRDYASIN
uniref:Uncharacterized protein n=1 Tax=Meloidogyne enterolobii TaxID=390850 RepID=A0A6V7WE66_MELEN|nr:unnamed protein product [Meloidogyne enterolobii]